MFQILDIFNFSFREQDLYFIKELCDDQIKEELKNIKSAIVAMAIH